MFLVGLLALVLLPVVVAVAALHGRRWVPILDLAMTELRVRDVGSSHPPLIGLPGRIGSLTEQGSHPGPISFWSLWPVHRILGNRSWGLQVGTAVLHVLAIGVVLWLARRRGGWPLALGAAAVLAVLVRTYGPATLTEPWNPYLPLFWWVVLLVAVWSVLCRDAVALPVVAVAASFCAQTHVPYVLGAAGLLALGVAGGVLPEVRAGGDRRRRAVRWAAASSVLLVALWSPLVVDELTTEPGNLTVLREHFTSPPEPTIGPGRGVELLLVHLDPIRLVRGQGIGTGPLTEASRAVEGSPLPGIAVLLAWAAAVAVAWRARHRGLLALHATLGVATVLAAVAMSRIFGFVWYYLTLWAWGTTAMVLLAVGWSAWLLVEPRLAARDPVVPPRVVRGGSWVLLGLTAMSGVALLPSAAEAAPPAPRLSATMARLVPSTVQALRDGGGAAAGGEGRYLVTWIDALSIGSQGYALVNELERAGLEVGALEPARAPVTPRRVLEAEDADAEVQFVSGIHIEAARSRPGFVEVARTDIRTDAERDEYARLRAAVIDELDSLERDDRDELVALVDGNVFATALDGRVPERARRRASRMLDLGLPAAVFVGPAS